MRRSRHRDVAPGAVRTAIASRPVAGRIAPLLAAAGIALLLGAWLVATPPFGAPDEPDHYIRAVGLADGQILGPRVPWIDPLISWAQLAWVQHDSRGYVLTPRLAIRRCVAHQGSSCLEPTHTGDYEPLPYLLPGLLARAAHSARQADWLARAAVALECLPFLCLALALAWTGSGWSLVGPLVAITPMTLFDGAVLNPNGPEIAAALAFAAAALRLARTPAGAPRWVWAALTISGVVMILSWQVGPVFVICDLLVLGAAAGRHRFTELRRTNRRPGSRAAILLLAALVVYLGYGLKAGLLHSSLSLSAPANSVQLGLVQLKGVLRQAVGVFGALDVQAPAVVYWAWWALVVAMAAGALAFGDRRDGRLMASTALAALAFPVLFFGFVYRYTGFPLQGRYVLPVLALIPLVAGEILTRGRARLPAAARRWAAPGVIVSAALVHLVAWWAAAHAASGGPDTIGLFDRASFSPPLGWLPWTLIAVAGTGALLACALTCAAGERRDGPQIA